MAVPHSKTLSLSLPGPAIPFLVIADKNFISAWFLSLHSKHLFEFLGRLNHQFPDLLIRNPAVSRFAQYRRGLAGVQILQEPVAKSEDGECVRFVAQRELVLGGCG